jgi:hypothetical protein
MELTLKQLVWTRAEFRCEYCLVPQSADDLPFHIDHIIARQHGGTTVASNLAIACYGCNLRKGPNLVGRDPRTKRIVKLFNPRRHKWSGHFRVSSAVLVGKTAIGRATIKTLGINLEHRVEFRESLVSERSWPPE